MSELRLEESKINYEGEWFTAEELTKRIQEKMQSGDLKIAQMAAALEELTDAIEKNQIIDVKFVISKEDYKKLNVVTGKDDSEKVKTVLTSYLNLEDFADPDAEQEESEESIGKRTFLG